MRKKDEMLTVRLPRTLKQIFLARCDERQLTMSEVLTAGIEHFIKTGSLGQAGEDRLAGLDVQRS